VRGTNTPRKRSLSAVSHRTLLIAAGIVVVLLLIVFGVEQCTYSPPANPHSGPAGTVVATPSSGLPTMPAADLPPEGKAVLALIDRGGPFRYQQDDTVFSNNEGRLPQRPRGYYHEYTVPTPGSPDRGARRLIAGKDGDIYYTADHYETFRQVLR
jgi:ribonuclease T1